jgi:hypothetical protein
LTTRPQSNAASSWWTFNIPLVVTSTVATTPTVVPASGLPFMPQLAIAIPCPMPLGRLLPQPDFSATSRSTLAQP